MGSVSRMPVVVDAILAAVRAVAPVDVGVYDGPYVTGDTRAGIHIGYDADPEGDGVAGSSDQAWAGLGARARDENLTVTGAIHLVQGDADVKAARDRGYQLLGLVEAALHTAPSLGLTPPTWMGVASHRLAYLPGETVGLEVWLRFEIAVRTRL